MVTTPSGDEESAQIARSLVPVSDARFRLVDMTEARIPLDNLTGESASGDADAGIGAVNTKTVEEAREAALAFNLVLAAALWRKEADVLLGSDALLLNPKGVADSLMETGAACAEAQERDLSLFYFRKAIAVDSDVHPGPSISPDAKRIFENARRQGPLLLDIPREPVLLAICRAASVDGIIWVAVGRDQGEWLVAYKTFLVGDTASELETRRYKDFSNPRVVADMQRRFGGIVARKVVGRDAANLSLVGISMVKLDVSRPWYRRWWVYAIGGALLAGGAVGVATWMVLRPEEATVTVNF